MKQLEGLGALHFNFAQIPEEGIEYDYEEKFDVLERVTKNQDFELQKQFRFPIRGHARVLKVGGSKLDVQGTFSTIIEAECVRCGKLVQKPVQGDLVSIMMPEVQFSEHDKPGGKVTHAPTRGGKESRHHSRSKSEVLTHSKEDFEYQHFGAFNGQNVDLRPLLREELILQMPMQIQCSGVDCLKPITEAQEEKTQGSLAKALRSRLEIHD